MSTINGIAVEVALDSIGEMNPEEFCKLFAMAIESEYPGVEVTVNSGLNPRIDVDMEDQDDVANIVEAVQEIGGEVFNKMCAA